MAWGRITRYKLFLALLMVLASLISTGASKYPDSGADTVADAPKEDLVRVANVSEDSEFTEDLEDANDPKVEPATDPGFELEIPTGGGASKIPVPKAGSNEDIPPISVLLNKVVWLEIGNRTLDGSGPYGRLVVNRLPICSPDFNRLLEDSGYSKVREFENESGSCSWWEDSGAPRLPYGEEDQGLGNETVQVKRFYVGWAYSKTYHYPDCRWAKNTPLGSQVWFSSPEEAKAAGYVPCGTCNPP
jgi:hypothetical protein